MPLDLTKLTKLKSTAKGYTSQCPACHETGGDTKGNHLSIDHEGRFTCVLHQGADGNDHRKRIAELAGLPTEPKGKVVWTALPHAPSNAPSPVSNHYKHGTPSRSYTYRTASGDIACVVNRFDLSNGKKETIPLSWCKSNKGDTGWQWKAMAEPRTIYNLPLTSDLVIVVEGEKCADAIKNAGFQSTTWAGGCGAVVKSDFTAIHGKRVVLWPDNDDEGRKAMRVLRSIIEPHVKSISIVSIPEGIPKGWDAADTTADQITELINGAEIADPLQPPPSLALTDKPSTPQDRIASLPFRILGMEDGAYRYMPDNGQHVVSLSPPSHTKLNLLQLAPIQSWEEAFPSSNGVNWDAVANALLQRSQSMPRFDPSMIRGRGCWIDGNDIIYHAGDRLSVNATIKPIRDHQTEYIYEAGLKIPLDPNPATNAEAARLIALCESLSFENALSGKILAGWLALAPICGALNWRPHIWITGSSGSGKTWVMGNIMSPMMGKSSIFVQSSSTEAGIRCGLGSDALPVMFDEAESNDPRGMVRMETVLELARQASSESGAGIVKGTQSGGSVTYLVRSMFCFSSIAVAAVKKADLSRICVLALKKTSDKQQFEKVKEIFRETTHSAEYCASIRARSIRNAITIRSNAEIFSDCAVIHTGDKRSADQIGTLLAGAYSLTSTKPITPEDAAKWLAKQDWSMFKSESIDSDESQCFAHLMSSPIKIERQNGADNMSIDEAIQMFFRSGCRDCEYALLRIGIRADVESSCIMVANNHQGLEKCFRDTPWAGAKWRGQLVRMDGATQSNVVRFTKNVTQRAVILPF